MNCNNCGTHKAVARNDEFCNVCERDYYQILTMIWRPAYKGENPSQLFADSLMEEFSTLTNNTQG